MPNAVTSGAVLQVYGADNAPDAIECDAVTVDAPTLLVMGNEGFGLRTNVKRACTGLIKIPAGAGSSEHLLESLNVSVATGIIVYGLLCSAKANHAAVPAAAN